MQFTDFSLDKRLLQSLKHMGIETPTPIQRQAIPVAMSGKDLMASSKTGSGKTLAFLLPALQRVISTKALSKRDPRVLILLPTRELAQQVYAQLRLLVANTQYRAISVLGGENFNDQAKALAKEPQFIVATPGRIADHLEQRHLFLSGLELLILDEADRMLDLGFAPQLKAINAAADHRRRQTLMFSATLDHGEVQELASELLNEPQHIAIDAVHLGHDDIEQKIILSDNLEHKEALLERLLQEQDFRQVMIFTATRQDTERLATLLASKGHSTAALSGELRQSQRNQIMDSFSRGHQRILVTTDVASRGLDIGTVSLVVNFDMPKFAEEYVHRIGRTGRAGNKGNAVSLVGPKDWDNFLKVQLLLRKTFEFSTLDALEAKFTGLAPKRARKAAVAKAEDGTKDKGKTAARAKSSKTGRDRRFHTGIDIGDAPLMRKKPLVSAPAPELTDDDEEEFELPE